MAKERMTKIDCLEALEKIVEARGLPQEEVLLEFIDNEINQIRDKAHKAQQRRKEKAKVSDELKIAIEKTLVRKHYQTIDEIIKALKYTPQDKDEKVTPAKVAPRLNKSIREGRVEKDMIKINGKRYMGYRLK